MLLNDILLFVFSVVIIGLGVVLTYGQYLLLKDRYEYKKQHGVDPWRERPDIDNE